MKTLILIIILLFTSIIAQAQCDKTNYDKLIREGDQLAKNEKYITAVRKYMAATIICPDNNEKTQQKIVKAYLYPWNISTNEDLRWPMTEGCKAGLLIRAMHSFTDWIGKAATIDRHVAYTYIKVLHMTATPLALLTPLMIVRMLISGFKHIVGKQKK